MLSGPFLSVAMLAEFEKHGIRWDTVARLENACRVTVCVVLLLTLLLWPPALIGQSSSFQSSGFRLERMSTLFTSADFNSDSFQDLVVQSTLGGVVILLGRGDGHFDRAPNPVGETATYSVAAGDFNGDGLQDLATADGSEELSFYLGRGDGTFHPAHRFAVGARAVAVTAVNLNSDSFQDLIVGIGRTGIVYVLHGRGEATFDAIQQLEIGPSSVLTTGDFNSDKRGDLAVVASGSTSLSVYLAGSDGIFQTSRTFGLGDRPFRLGEDKSIAVGDFNLDSNMDLAVSNGNGDMGDNSVSILLGNGNGTFRPAHNFQVGCWAKSVTAGDFNGDALPDLAVADAQCYGGVHILSGNGEGGFQIPGGGFLPQRFGAAGFPSFIAAANFNSDSLQDLAVIGSTTLSILINNTRLGPPPVLKLNSTQFCVGASWTLEVTNAAGEASVRLLGSSNGTSWQIPQWASTDSNGSLTVHGVIAEGMSGSHALRVHIGESVSNTISFAVSSCRPSIP